MKTKANPIPNPNPDPLADLEKHHKMNRRGDNLCF